MSLSITTTSIDPLTGNITKQDPYPENGKDLAGVESWRHKVYASNALISRGAVFLPKLLTEDLFIFGADLHSFSKELKQLIEDIPEISIELDIDAEGLKFRFNNILTATQYAISKGKAVWIS